MLKTKFQLTKKVGVARRKLRTIPDQSLSIMEIVRRFTRGIPVDVIQRQGVFVDQSEHDLEKLNRMDFGDKAAMADQLQAQNDEVKERYETYKRAQQAQEEQKRQDESKGAGSARHSNPLDNTMPVDTKQTTK